MDKDTIINAVTSSHDVHMLKIDNREDDLITRINGWLSKLIEDIHETEEVQRNRKRVTEITNLIDHLRDEIDNLDLRNQDYWADFIILHTVSFSAVKVNVMLASSAGMGATKTAQSIRTQPTQIRVIPRFSIYQKKSSVNKW